MKTHRLRGSFYALAILATLTAPALADGREPDRDLAGTKWTLVSLSGTPTDPATTTTLNITAGGVGGNGGCNTYGGKLVYTANGIEISDVFSTMMACEGLPQEQAYFKVLSDATGYAIEDGNLHLTDAEGKTLAELAPSE